MVAAKWNREQNFENPIIRKSRPKHVKTSKKLIILEKRGEFPCRYCNKKFSSEKIVANHMCEQRRRYEQRNTAFAKYGLEAFSTIQRVLFRNDSKNKEEDFRKSDFYLACIRWGHFVIEVHCLEISQYLHWLMKLNVPIDNWNKDEIYDCWLTQYAFVELPWDSFKRSISSMIKWSDEVNKPYQSYFAEAGTARIITDIQRCLITGWLIFCSDSGKLWLSSLTQNDLNLIWGWVDASRWKIRLDKFPSDVAGITKICVDSKI
jgi:hypothetical protein